MSSAIGYDRRAISHVDWPYFARLADRHRVGTLLHRSPSLQEAGAPPEVVSRFEQDAREAGRRALRDLALQRDVVAMLDSLGVDVLVLKGLPLAQEAFADLGARQMRDIDILVRSIDVEQAAVVLERLGLDYARPEDWSEDDAHDLFAKAGRLPCVKDALFVGERGAVELHWRLTTNERLMPVRPEWLAAPRVMDVAGVPTPALPQLEGWWQLLVHGAEHDWHRLKWLADIAALARREPDLLSPGALRAAEAAGLERCVASGLIVAERTLGPFVTPEARAWIHRVKGTRTLVQRALRALTAPDVAHRKLSPGTLPGFARGRLALRGDRGFRAAEARCLLIDAARVQAAPDPSWRDLLRGPPRWLARVIRRSAATTR